MRDLPKLPPTPKATLTMSEPYDYYPASRGAPAQPITCFDYRVDFADGAEVEMCFYMMNGELVVAVDRYYEGAGEVEEAYTLEIVQRSYQVNASKIRGQGDFVLAMAKYLYHEEPGVFRTSPKDAREYAEIQKEIEAELPCKECGLKLSLTPLANLCTTCQTPWQREWAAGRNPFRMPVEADAS